MSQREDVFTIKEVPGRQGEQPRKIWTRIGTAFVNRDGSRNVILDALPVNGTMHIRVPSPPPGQQGQQGGYQGQQGGYQGGWDDSPPR